MASRRTKRIALGLAAAVGIAAIAAIVPPAGARSLRAFDPDRIADLETSMWRAYYAKQHARLFGGLVVTMREQYRFSWLDAARVALCFGRAAAGFGDARGGYDAFLPDLRDGYAIVRRWTGAGFDPDRVAAQELAWWVARRVPGEDDAANVGRLIGEEYLAIYGLEDVQDPTIRAAALRAGALRAEAGKLRDRGGASADWGRVHGLLVESWRALHDAVNR